MLSIGPMSAGQEGYYTKLASTDYYTKSGEPPGEWWGEAALMLGLSGRVDAGELSNLIMGFSRDGSEPLVRNAGHRKRRAGFDLTFSAPKSVSVMWALKPEFRKQLEEAHQAAVKKALEYLQEEAAWTRTGAGGLITQKANLLVAIFEHGSARATKGHLPDPHLHSHCLAINMCFGQRDDKARTIDGRQLFRNKMTAGVLYRTELFSQIRSRLGLSASRGEAWCELDAVTEKDRNRFSKRRNQIETYIEEIGVEGAKASAKAALKTRTNKVVANRSALFEGWREAAIEHGVEFDDSRSAALSAAESNKLVADALPSALARVTKHSSHFAKRDILRALAELVEPKGVPIGLIRENVEEVMPDFVDLGLHQGEQRWTTEEMLELEQSMADTARVLWHRSNSVSTEVADAVIESRPTMTEEQEEAVRHVTTGGSLAAVSGLAGTGKTYMLETARLIWEEDGRHVYGAAVAAVAAKRLEEGSGIKSASMHRTLLGIKHGPIALNRNTILVVDEAGMVGTRQMHELVHLVDRSGAKVVLVGDQRQLTPIEAGAPFAAIRSDLGARIELTDIRRQTQQWARDAVKEFSLGQTERALQRFDERGLLFVDNDKEEAVERIAQDWMKMSLTGSPQDAFVLAGKRADAAHVNGVIQRKRQEFGQLQGDGIGVSSGKLFVGDRVRFRRNSQWVNNGDSGRVVAVDDQARTLTAELDDGQHVSIDVAQYPHVELGYASTTHAGQGATVKECFVLCDDQMQHRESTYVEASRASEQTRFYMTQDTAGEQLERISALMERSRQNEMATDLLAGHVGPEALSLMMEAA